MPSPKFKPKFSILPAPKGHPFPDDAESFVVRFKLPDSVAAKFYEATVSGWLSLLSPPESCVNALVSAWGFWCRSKTAPNVCIFEYPDSKQPDWCLITIKMPSGHTLTEFGIHQMQQNFAGALASAPNHGLYATIWRPHSIEIPCLRDESALLALQLIDSIYEHIIPIGTPHEPAKPLPRRTRRR